MPYWNYLDRTMHPTYDLTRIDRLPTNTECPKLNKLNADINAKNEIIEDMFIGIELANIEREEKTQKKKRLKPSRKVKELFENIDDTTRAELESEGFELE